MLVELPDRAAVAEMYEKLKKNSKRHKHRELIEYYYMVKNVAEEQVAGLTLDKKK